MIIHSTIIAVNDYCIGNFEGGIHIQDNFGHDYSLYEVYFYEGEEDEDFVSEFEEVLECKQAIMRGLGLHHFASLEGCALMCVCSDDELDNEIYDLIITTPHGLELNLVGYLSYATID